jgi:leucyl-tRNA synthetase
LAVLATAELLQDADFSSTLAKSMRDRLERLHKFALETLRKVPEKDKTVVLTVADRWILSRLQEHVKMATEAMDGLAVRKAIHSALYELDQDFQWYLRRIVSERGAPNRKKAIATVFNDVLEAQVRMLAPVTPHICEELWEKMGGKGFISLAFWPKPDEARIDAKAEENEALIMSTLEDTLKIVKATGMTPKKVCYYVAASWKWKTYQKVLKEAVSAKLIQGELMKELIKDPDLKNIAKQVAAFVGKMIEEVNKMSDQRKNRQLNVGVINENEALKEAKEFFKRELNAEVSIYSEEDSKRYDPKNRAQLAKPYRPAIYIE